MANSNLSLEALKSHLFETLEGVKNLNDAQADEADKISLDQANCICGIAGKIIDTYKLQFAAVKTFRGMDSMDSPGMTAAELGFIGKEDAKLLN